jgi:hypothetical protein
MTVDINSVTFTTVNSVAELMNWAEHFADLSARRFAFRGQPQEFGSLAPSFNRQFSNSSPAAAELIERELIREFRAHYARLPDRSFDMPTPESIAQQFDLRCLSVMQHYEVPTRLLDWTSDIWTAVYFACASDPSINAELWIYDRDIFEPQLVASPPYRSLLIPDRSPSPEPQLLGRRGEKLLLELDLELTPRMKHQMAHHTVSASVFSDHAEQLAELASQANTSHPDEWYFKRMVLAGACKGKALRFLADHQKITASTIFPDVVGLGRFLRWQLDSLRTMLM